MAGPRPRARSPGRRRNNGYDYLHVATDDHTRIAFVQAHADEKGTTCAGFLTDALAFYAELGIQVERVLTDNAKNYVLSRDFQAALGGCTHKRIRPYRAQTNGEAERFSTHTLLDEWASAPTTPTSNASRRCSRG